MAKMILDIEDLELNADDKVFLHVGGEGSSTNIEVDGLGNVRVTEEDKLVAQINVLHIANLIQGKK